MEIRLSISVVFCYQLLLVLFFRHAYGQTVMSSETVIPTSSGLLASSVATTSSSGVFQPTPTTTTTTPTTPPPNPCQSSPCGSNEECVRDGESGYTCPCAPGFGKNPAGECARGKPFQGEFSSDEEWSDSYDDPSSDEYTNKKEETEAALKETYSNEPDYVSSEVTGFRSGSIVTEYVIIYNESTTKNANEVQEVLMDGCGFDNCTIGNITFITESVKVNEPTSPCDNNATNPCVSPAGDCVTAPDGYSYRCECSEGYEKNGTRDDYRDSCAEINVCDDESLNDCKLWATCEVTGDGGHRCNNEERNKNIAIIVGIAGGVLLVGAVITGVCCYSRGKTKGDKRHKGDKGVPSHIAYPVSGSPYGEVPPVSTDYHIPRMGLGEDPEFAEALAESRRRRGVSGGQIQAQVHHGGGVNPAYA